MLLVRLLAVVVISIGHAAASAAEPPRPPRAAIASAHPLATRAGEEILEQGGNAFDAAVAVSAALAVVEPQSSGLGGGGFWLLHEAASGRQVFVDGREVAPASATPDMYLDKDGEPRRGATLDGPLAAGIPGQPAAMVHLAERYGRLPLEALLEPAIRYAEEGFALTRSAARGLRFRASAGRRSPGFAGIFYPGGEPLGEGDRLRQPDLADTLRRLARDGFDGFYGGETAARLVEGVRAAGGIWTAADLAAYRVVERKPIRSTHGGVTLVSAPPPSAGGIGLANMLNILAGFDFDGLEPGVREHVVIEAMRRAYRDRAIYLGDPDHVAVPVERLLSPYYADGQRTTIRLDRATPSSQLAGIWPGGAGADTTHFSVLDAEGNRVAATLSINTFFGAAFVPPGTGVILNNEMDDFSIRTGVPNGYQLLGAEANAIAPGKRMLSSMSPTFLESDRGIAILGTPGGSRIITMVLLAALEWMEGAGADSMVALPRFHHQYYPDVVVHETDAFSAGEKAALEARGHRLQESPRVWGNMNVVTWDFGSGRVEAATDPRGNGEGLVY